MYPSVWNPSNSSASSLTINQSIIMIQSVRLHTWMLLCIGICICILQFNIISTIAHQHPHPHPHHHSSSSSSTSVTPLPHVRPTPDQRKFNSTSKYQWERRAEGYEHNNDADEYKQYITNHY